VKEGNREILNSTKEPNRNDIASLIDQTQLEGLSKNAKKRLLKDAKWAATRADRAQTRKEKKKRKQAERKELLEQG